MAGQHTFPWMAGAPIMGNGETLQEAPDPKAALQSWGTGATATSSILNLTDNTTVLDVTVLSGSGAGGLALRWVRANDTQGSVIANGATANFDHVIPAQWRQRLVVPIDPSKVAPGSSSMAGVNVQKGLYSRVAIIGTHAPVPSVFISEA